jgi:hypothetical protein
LYLLLQITRGNDGEKELLEREERLQNELKREQEMHAFKVKELEREEELVRLKAKDEQAQYTLQKVIASSRQPTPTITSPHPLYVQYIANEVDLKLYKEKHTEASRLVTELQEKLAVARAQAASSHMLLTAESSNSAALAQEVQKFKGREEGESEVQE